MNFDEKIYIPSVGLPTISVGKMPFVNVFGIPDMAYDIVDKDNPYLLWEDGSLMLWEDGDKIMLEQDKMRVWRQRAKR